MFKLLGVFCFSYLFSYSALASFNGQYRCDGDGETWEITLSTPMEINGEDAWFIQALNKKSGFAYSGFVPAAQTRDTSRVILRYNNGIGFSVLVNKDTGNISFKTHECVPL